VNAADFDTQFNRLTQHFHLPTDGTRETLAMDWFKAVEHYHVDALERAVTELTRTSQDRFWPALGKVLTLIQSRIDRYERTSGKCQTCHGSTWIESAPFKANGMIYEGVCIRCPDCGTPAPPYTPPAHRKGLTSSEYAQWAQGDHERDYMPEFAKAKPWKPESLSKHKAEMHAMFERLRIKLFGAA